MYTPHEPTNLQRNAQIPEIAQPYSDFAAFQTPYVLQTTSKVDVAAATVFKVPDNAPAGLLTAKDLETASTEITAIPNSQLDKITKKQYIAFRRERQPLQDFGTGRYFVKVELTTGEVFYSEVYYVPKSAVRCFGTFHDGVYPESAYLDLLVINDGHTDFKDTLQINWQFLRRNTLPHSIPTFISSATQADAQDSYPIEVPAKNTKNARFYFGGNQNIIPQSKFDVPRDEDYFAFYTLGNCSGSGDWAITSSPLTWSNFTAERTDENEFTVSVDVENTTGNFAYYYLSFYAVELVASGGNPENFNILKKGYIPNGTYTITVVFNPTKQTKYKVGVAGHYIDFRVLNNKVFLYPAFNFHGSSTQLVWEGADTSNWASVHVTPTLDPAYPPPALTLDAPNKTIKIVGFSLGTCAGIEIRDVLGNPIHRLTCAEGAGPFGQNIYLYDVLSSGAAPRPKFVIQNADLSQAWTPPIERESDPYEFGYSETVYSSPNIIKNGDAETGFPEFEGVYTVDPDITATLDTSTFNSGTQSLKLEVTNPTPSGKNMYFMGDFTALGNLVAGDDYEFLISVTRSATGEPFVRIRTDAGFRDFGIPTTTGVWRSSVFYDTLPLGATTFQIRLYAEPRTNIPFGTTFYFDDMSFRTCSRRIFYNVKIPPHATESGTDAEGLTLNAPA